MKIVNFGSPKTGITSFEEACAGLGFYALPPKMMHWLKPPLYTEVLHGATYWGDGLFSRIGVETALEIVSVNSQYEMTFVFCLRNLFDWWESLQRHLKVYLKVTHWAPSDLLHFSKTQSVPLYAYICDVVGGEENLKNREAAIAFQETRRHDFLTEFRRHHPLVVVNVCAGTLEFGSLKVSDADAGPGASYRAFCDIVRRKPCLETWPHLNISPR
jgi:hypothetical protein